MGRICFLLSTAVLHLLLSSVAQAQVGLPNYYEDHATTPGWKDYRALAERLDSLEAENSSLRSQVLSSNEADGAAILPVEYCAACNQLPCGCDRADNQCGWLNQLSAACKEGLSWNKGQLRIVPFGYFAADMIASEKAYTLLGGPLFLLPAVPPDIPDSRFTFTGQQTTLGANVTGPNLGDYESSAVAAFNFFGDRPVQNNPGVFFVLGYLQLQSDEWRFWGGQDADAIGRQNTNSPAWTSHKQSGNFGQIRPGFRAERTFLLDDDAVTSIYLGLTQQVVLDFIANPQVAGTDNGWPNIEFRCGLDLGTNNEGIRPVTIAVGGLIGETRAVDFTGQAKGNVSTTWAVIPELRLQLGRVGFHGEAFIGDAIGTYNAGIGQSLNIITDEAIYTVGGFGELFYELFSDLTIAVGYGIDDPRNSDLGPNQRSRNETYWTNAIWRLNDQWETRFEVARLETDWTAPSVGNKAMQYLVSVRYYF